MLIWHGHEEEFVAYERTHTQTGTNTQTHTHACTQATHTHSSPKFTPQQETEEDIYEYLILPKLPPVLVCVLLASYSTGTNIFCQE